MKFSRVVALVLLLPVSTAAQDDVPLLHPSVADALHEELSGELAKEHVIAITRHHRIQGSRGYRHAAEYVVRQLREFGFDERDASPTGPQAWIESFPSDGRVEYQTWQSPSGWDITSAELRMLQPHEERIVAYPEIAMSVMTYCNPGDIAARLVWVGSGESDEDYEGKDVAGAFVLATGYGGEVHRKAVIERGAAAVVCFLDDARAAEYPDMLQYTGIWPRTEELEWVTFGFNLTNRQGTKLRDLLIAGEEVVLRGTVEGTGLEPYFMDIVVATIPGATRPDEELVFIAHLDHPKESANDNASGSGAILDIARALNTLIKSGKLPPPERTLRFLWVPEFFGTMAYVDAHPEFVGPDLGGKVLAGVNMDMVGENLELLHSKLKITRTPDSLPSCVNDVVANMAAMVDGMDVRTPRGSLSEFNYRVTPYQGGSDHMVLIDRKIPTAMMWHDPDYTHHTSEDTPDKVDPVELERCELIAAGTVWYLANLNARQARDLAFYVGGRGMGRIAGSGRSTTPPAVEPDQSAASESPGVFETVIMLVTLPVAVSTALEGMFQELFGRLERRAHVLMREVVALQSVRHFHDDNKLSEGIRAQGLAYLHAAWGLNAIEEEEDGDAKVALWLDFVENGTKAAILGIDDDAEADTRIPVRLTRGPLAFGLPERRLPAEDAAWYASAEFPFSSEARFELVNFIDGELMTVSHIHSALSAEFERFEEADVARYLGDLVEIGVVAWK